MKSPYLAAALMMVSVPALAADELCSGDGPDRHVLEYRAESYDFAIRHAGKLVNWTFENSGGTGIPARLFKSDAGEEAVTMETDVVMDANVEPPQTRHVVIFQDRAFWPCK